MMPFNLITSTWVMTLELEEVIMSLKTYSQSI